MKEFSIDWWNSERGNVVDIDDNLCDCATWTVGDSRCECGNRRIYLEEFDKDYFLPSAD
tara:strand:- start:262 stop:438 length:177 start_codon:yes stop_codon:yes gene_type:complete